MKGHKKHSTLVKPDQGKFHRNEWSIIGAPCPRILQIADKINDQLKAKINLAYLDDDHNADDAEEMSFDSAIQNRVKYFSYFFKTPPTRFTYRQLLNELDAVLLNGNHYTARKQIVIINQKKKESLSKKLDRLTDVSLVILDEEETELYDFLIPIIDPNTTPIYKVDDIKGISDYLLKAVKEKIAPLAGLVLAGGKSMRMGTDKSNLNYHGVDQLTYSAQLLGKYCPEVFISAANADHPAKDKFTIIPDSFAGLGPFGGIVSAFRQNPNMAYLTMPCDVPLVDEELLNELISRRNPGKMATCFHNPATNFPEPLITIWEPRAYPILLQFLAQGFSCPRKVLINSEVEEIHTEQAEKLANVNTPEEMENIKKRIANNSQSSIQSS